MPEPKRTSLTPILAVNFVGTLGFSIVLPFLVFVVTRFGGNAVIYGLMGATYSAFQLIGAPILGRWSDVQGRRKILLLSQIGTLLSWLVFLGAMALPVQTIREFDTPLLGAFTLTVPLLVLFLARALDGLTGGNVSVANAYLADITDDADRSKNFGKMAVAANAGFVFGPAIAGLLGATAMGETLPVLAAIAISGVATLIILLKLPESKPCDIESTPDQPDMHKLMGQEQKDCYDLSGTKEVTLRDALRQKNIPYLLTLYFLIYLGFNFFYVAFPVHAVKALNWELTQTGIFFSFVGLAMATVQGPVLSRLSSRVNDATLVLSGSFILAISFVFFTSLATPLLYTGAALLSIGNGLMWAAVLSILSRTGEPRYQGTVQGFAGSAGSAASILGLVSGGVLYELLHGDVFLIAAAVIGVVFLMALRLPVLETGKRI